MKSAATIGLVQLCSRSRARLRGRRIRLMWPSAIRASFDAAVWTIGEGLWSVNAMDPPPSLRVLGRGMRGSIVERMTEPVTPAELCSTSTIARAEINARDPERSLLLTKPLDVSAGGSGHEGAIAWSRRDRSAADPSYQVLRSWVIGAPPL